MQQPGNPQGTKLRQSHSPLHLFYTLLYILFYVTTPHLYCLLSNFLKIIVYHICLFGFGCCRRESISSPYYSNLVRGASLAHFNKRSYTLLNSDESSAWDAKDNSRLLLGKTLHIREAQESREKFLVQDVGLYTCLNTLFIHGRRDISREQGGLCRRNAYHHLYYCIIIIHYILQADVEIDISCSEREAQMAVIIDFRDYCQLGMVNRLFSYNLEPDT